MLPFTLTINWTPAADIWHSTLCFHALQNTCTCTCQSVASLPVHTSDIFVRQAKFLAELPLSLHSSYTRLAQNASIHAQGTSLSQHIEHRDARQGAVKTPYNLQEFITAALLFIGPYRNAESEATHSMGEFISVMVHPHDLSIVILFLPTFEAERDTNTRQTPLYTVDGRAYTANVFSPVRSNAVLGLLHRSPVVV